MYSSPPNCAGMPDWVTVKGVLMSTNEARYAPPQAEVGAIEAAPRSFEPASRGRRFVTFIIDYAFIYLFMFMVGVISALVDQTAWLEEMGPLQEKLLGVTLFFTYYVLTETLLGRSLAKWITGVQVLTVRGGRPSRLQLLKRSAVRLVLFEFLSIFRGDTRMWHDNASDTVSARVVAR